MLLNCGVGEDSSESLGLQGDPTSPFWRRSVLNVHWKDWCWSWNSNPLPTWCKELIHLKRPWCWERLRAGRESDNRGWDGWMASPTQWTWVWVNSRSWWRTGRPGVLQSMELQSRTWLSDWTELKEEMFLREHLICLFSFPLSVRFFLHTLSIACTHTHTHTHTRSLISYHPFVPIHVDMAGIFAFFSKFTGSNTSAQCDGIKRWDLDERCLSHEARALVSGITAFMKETPQSSLAPSAVWGYNEKSVTWKKAFTQTHS